MIHTVICGNDRPVYRAKCIASLVEYVRLPFTICNDDTHAGMAANVQKGFDLFLKTDADYVLWVEEDFIWLRRPPLEQAVEILDSHPKIAQMLFQRQPLAPAEIAAGSVIGGMDGAVNRGDWWEQQHIFSLNPCLIPRRVVELGWPAGPLGVGNETGMTHKLLDAGFSFGVWDGQYVEHIGAERGPGWAL